MRLLIITHDRRENLPRHTARQRWIKEFARVSRNVIVLTGNPLEHSSHANVQMQYVRGADAWGGSMRCWWHARALRGSYDAILLERSSVWMAMFGFLWLLLRKPLYLWLAYPKRWKLGGMLRSSLSQPQVGTGAFHYGIDTTFWAPTERRKDPTLVIAKGKLLPAERIELIVQCFSQLPRYYRLTIIGTSFVEADSAYVHALKQKIHAIGLEERIDIVFLDDRSARTIMRTAVLLLHANRYGTDEHLLQAMALGIPVVSTSEERAFLPAACLATPRTFANVTFALLHNPNLRAMLHVTLRNIVEAFYSFSKLAIGIKQEVQREPAPMPIRHFALSATALLIAGCSMQ